MAAAFVDLGDGTAHDPQIRFTAPDESCMWNGFPVQMGADFFAGGPSVIYPTYQLAGYATPTSAGPWGVPEANWPFLHVYDYVTAWLAGYALQVRVTGFSGANPMQVDVVNTYGGAWTLPSTYYTGGFDTGWSDTSGPDCAQASTSPDGTIYLQVVVRQFNPTLSSKISGGVLRARWVAGGGSASYNPKQPLGVVYRPPGYVAQGPADFDAGLYIFLATNSCGDLTKTYIQVRDAVNALDQPIVASINHDGSDIAKPDLGTMSGAGPCDGTIHVPHPCCC